MPQLGGNARRGGGLARRRGRRVRPHRRALPAADRGRHERRARPPRDVRLARRGRGALRRAGSPRCRTVVRGEELEPVDARARRARASTTGATPRPRSRRSSSRASPRADAERALAEFRGVGRRLERARRGRRRRGLDDYGHHPTEIAATLAAARERRPAAACSSSSSRTSTRARATSRASSARALAAADAVAVTDDLRGARGAGRRA